MFVPPSCGLVLAIPSPDLVVNLFASAGQALGLVFVVLGGAAVSARRQRGTARAPRATRGPLWAAAGLWVATSCAFFLYYAHVQDADQARLRVNLLRSSTEAGRAVGDTSLKTLSLSGQLAHPAGISTQHLQAALDAGAPLNLIDVRETEEVERGRMPGSWHVRYPDLRAEPEGLSRDGAKTVLLCFSGNRSSELCDEFRSDGADCWFMVGGYEKWIAEGRPLEQAGSRSPDELRSLPQFPRGDVLLDTPDVQGLVAAANAIFVDVRYPEDFAADHLPGAVNLPVRKLRTAELTERLAALPEDRPVIVPCYDKRSSFYALILGLKVHRTGREFLGRYTVPHEFVAAPPSARAHVAAWQEARAGVTLFGTIEGGLRTALLWLRDACGSLGLAILLLVVLLRGVLLPLSWKADVDQWRRKRLAPRVKELQLALADDAGRARRAVLALYRSAGLTPLRNLAASVAQLVLFLLFFAVVRDAAGGSTESFLGLWELGSPASRGDLPIVVGFLMALLVCGGRASRWKVAAACGLGLGMLALTWGLSAAANLYLVASLCWVLAQQKLARWRVLAVPRQLRPHADRSDRGVVTLAEAAHCEGAGNKAVRLGRMKRAGLPVPDGFALTDRALERAGRSGYVGGQDRVSVLRQQRRLGADRVAVRSSGLNEDGDDKSYAGVFDSILDVTPDRLFHAIEQVRRSMDSDRARAYGDGDERGGIVVQAMVPAEYAGVLFTEHPGSSGSMLVELVAGLGEHLVGGAVTPERFAFTRLSGRPLDQESPPIDLAPLLKLGRRVEELFGAPQDIEWAFANGRFHLLQARDITVRAGSGSSAAALRERERARVLAAVTDAEPDQVVFAQNELSELLPRPTPFSLAFMNSLWAPGGSVDLACRSLGIPFAVPEDAPDLVVDLFGQLYVDRREERRRAAKGPGCVASFRLSRGADAMETDFRNSFQPEFDRRMRRLEAIDLRRLDDDTLFDLWRELRHDFVTSTYVEAERINIAADSFVKSASIQLRRRGIDVAVILADIPETVVHRAFELLPEIRAGRAERSAFLQQFGHRANHDFELAEPRYAEDPALVDELLRRAPDAPRRDIAPRWQRRRRQFGPVLELAIDRARRFQALKEAAKHAAMRELALFRAATVEIGRRRGLEDRVFWLSPDEVGALESAGAVEDAVDARIEVREARAAACAAVDLPVRLTPSGIESLRLDGTRQAAPDGALHGERVAGERDLTARVRVLRDAGEIDELEPGEILVARFTDPAWAAVFPIVGGLVTEVGGWLSHAAIQAREHGLIGIVGVDGAMDALRTGDVVRLGLDGSIEKVAEGVATPETGAKIFAFGTSAIHEPAARRASSSGA